MNHREAKSLMDRGFVEGPLNQKDAQSLRGHLHECAGCQERYDRLARLSIGMANIDADPNGDGDRDGEWTDRVDEKRVDAMARQLFGAPLAKSTEPMHLGALRWLLAMAAAGSAAALAVALWPTQQAQQQADAPQLFARGGGTLGRGIRAISAREEQVAVRFFTLQEGLVRELRAEAGAAPLDRRAPLKLAYTSLDRDVKKLTVCAIDAAGGSRCSHEGQSAVAVAPGAVSRTLDGETALADLPVGLVRVYALFSEGELSADELEQALRGASGLSLEHADRLNGLRGVLQDGILLRLFDGEDAESER